MEQANSIRSIQFLFQSRYILSIQYLYNIFTLKFTIIPLMSRYDIEEKNNRFMEFISREMMRNKRNRSYVQQPKPRNSKGVLAKDIQRQKQRDRSVADIYSHTQIARQRRGASVLKSTGSKSRYNESRDKKLNISKDTSLNFYEGLKNRQRKPKEETTVTVGMMNQDEIDLEDVHYEMVRMQHKMKKLQSNS